MTRFWKMEGLHTSWRQQAERMQTKRSRKTCFPMKRTRYIVNEIYSFQITFIISFSRNTDHLGSDYQQKKTKQNRAFTFHCYINICRKEEQFSPQTTSSQHMRTQQFSVKNTYKGEKKPEHSTFYFTSMAPLSRSLGRKKSIHSQFISIVHEFCN